MKLPKTSVLLCLAVGLLIFLVAIGVSFGNTTPPPAVITVLVAIFVALLITCVIIAWRLKQRLGAQKFILLCGAVAFVWCGLFPPWLYTVYQTGTRDEAGVRSENSAGYYFILAPPRPLAGGPAYGVKLDTGRLLIEWACILAATGAAWVILGVQWLGVPDAKWKSQSLPEAPRRHHYNFAYKALPGLAFTDPHVPLGFGNDVPKGSLAKFWNLVGSKLPEGERVSDAGLRGTGGPFDENYSIVLVTLPKPERKTEAYHVAIVYPKSWFKSPAYENSNPPEPYPLFFILEKSDVPGPGGAAGATLRVLTRKGHGAVAFGVPVSDEAFLTEILKIIGTKPQFITWVDNKTWNFFMQDAETGETFGAD